MFIHFFAFQTCNTFQKKVGTAFTTLPFLLTTLQRHSLPIDEMLQLIFYSTLPVKRILRCATKCQNSPHTLCVGDRSELQALFFSHAFVWAKDCGFALTY